jgi:hypothetical protein
LALKFRILPLLLIFPMAAAALHAQGRSDVKVFIAPPVSNPGIKEQEDFFAEQFKSEISAAGYAITDNKDESDYTVQLTVDDNPYADDPGEKKYSLTLALLRSAENSEIVRFSWPFTELTEMYQWNLYLAYQALANVPLTKGGDDRQPVGADIAEIMEWRNKRLYVNVGTGLDMGYFIQTGTPRMAYGMVMPTAFVGAEFRILPFFAVETDPIKARIINNGNQYIFTFCFPLLLKAVIDFKDVMIEPYAGAEYSMAFGATKIPPFSVLGGVQVAFRAGKRTAFALGMEGTYSLSAITLTDGSSFGMIRFSLFAVWKIGFFDLPDRSPKAAPDTNAGKTK